MASASPKSHIDRLPPELFQAILEQLRARGSSLINCMLCCKAWHAQTQPTLYQHLVLSTSRIHRYIALCPSTPRTDGNVLSLTLRLDDPQPNKTGELRSIRISRSARTGRLWWALNALSLRVADAMTRLRSFSIIRPSMEPPAKGFWISYAVLEAFIMRLPETCVSLELDVNVARAKGTHLCPSIRSKLPQLEYLRLRLPELCPDICGIRSASSDVSASLEPLPLMSAPRLKQGVINTNLFEIGSSATTLCESQREYAWSHLVAALSEMVDTVSTTILEKLWLVSVRDQKPIVHSTSYEFNTAMVRHDVLCQCSQSLPIRKVGRDLWFVRLPDLTARDTVGSPFALSTVIEDHMWEGTESGVRLPQPLMKSYGLQSSLLVYSAAEFRIWGKQTSKLWQEEKQTGMKMLDVKEGGLLEQPRVDEIVPEGWIRTIGGTLHRL